VTTVTTPSAGQPGTTRTAHCRRPHQDPGSRADGNLLERVLTAVDARLADLIEHLSVITGPDEVAVVADAAKQVVWVSDTVAGVLGWTPQQFRLVCTHLI
jgi:hypothetical protein